MTSFLVLPMYILSLSKIAVNAETYYTDYMLLNPVSSFSTDYNTCIASCLKTTTCVALSVCTQASSVTCYIDNCANIQLVKTQSCTSIVFSKQVQVILSKRQTQTRFSVQHTKLLPNVYFFFFICNFHP